MATPESSAQLEAEYQNWSSFIVANSSTIPPPKRIMHVHGERSERLRAIITALETNSAHVRQKIAANAQQYPFAERNKFLPNAKPNEPQELQGAAGMGKSMLKKKNSVSGIIFDVDMADPEPTQAERDNLDMVAQLLKPVSADTAARPLEAFAAKTSAEVAAEEHQAKRLKLEIPVDPHTARLLQEWDDKTRKTQEFYAASMGRALEQEQAERFKKEKQARAESSLLTRFNLH